MQEATLSACLTLRRSGDSWDCPAEVELTGERDVATDSLPLFHRELPAVLSRSPGTHASRLPSFSQSSCSCSSSVPLPPPPTAIAGNLRLCLSRSASGAVGHAHGMCAVTLTLLSLHELIRASDRHGESSWRLALPWWSSRRTTIVSSSPASTTMSCRSDAQAGGSC